MSQKKIKLRVFETADCPMYREGDTFFVSGIAMIMEGDEGGDSLVTTTVVRGPENRKNCRILGGDFNRLIIEHERADLIPEGVVMCSGCIGSAILEFSEEDEAEKDTRQAQKIDKASNMLHLLQSFPFFRNIDRRDLKSVVESFTMARYRSNLLRLKL